MKTQPLSEMLHWSEFSEQQLLNLVLTYHKALHTYHSILHKRRNSGKDNEFANSEDWNQVWRNAQSVISELTKRNSPILAEVDEDLIAPEGKLSKHPSAWVK